MMVSNRHTLGHIISQLVELIGEQDAQRLGTMCVRERSGGHVPLVLLSLPSGAPT